MTKIIHSEYDIPFDWKEKFGYTLIDCRLLSTTEVVWFFNSGEFEFLWMGTNTCAVNTLELYPEQICIFDYRRSPRLYTIKQFGFFTYTCDSFLCSFLGGNFGGKSQMLYEDIIMYYANSEYDKVIIKSKNK